MTNNKIHSLVNSQEISAGLSLLQIENSDGLLREYKSKQYYRPKENAEFLTVYRNIELELARLLVGWISSVSIFDLKMELGYQAYLMIKIVDYLDSRLKTLPKKQTTTESKTRYKFLRQNLAKARNYEEFLIGVFKVIQTEFLKTLDNHLLSCDPIADLPTIDCLEDVREVVNKQIKWSHKWTIEYERTNNNSQERVQYISALLTSIGGINGKQAGKVPPSPYNNHQSIIDACTQPAKLEDGYNIVEEFMYISPRETEGKVVDVLYHNFAEIFVPDSLGYMMYDIDDMPYEFYRDFIVQIWDECRHTSMGKRELEKLGISVKNLPINKVTKDNSYTWLLATIGYTGEGCSFPRKLSSIDAFFKHDLPSAAIVTEYDIVDESHHVKYIEKWLPYLHEKEGLTASLRDVIEQAQKDALKRWSKAKRSEDYEVRAKKLTGKFGKFGAFCKEIDFDIDFNKV